MIKSSIRDFFKGCCSHLFKLPDFFCLKCGRCSVDGVIALRHIRYDYRADISPKDMLSQMIKNSLNLRLDCSMSLIKNEIYLGLRKELISIILRISSKLCYSSSTYYLCICYMDLISKNSELSNMNYYLISMSCLSLASKYNERDPLVSQLDLICSIMSEVTKSKQVYTINDLKQMEVFSLKNLNYKLNYYTLYDFVVFIFIHGLLLEDQLNAILSYDAIKRYLEKAYDYSRDIIDKILEDSNILFKYNCLDLSIAAIKQGIIIAFGYKYGDLLYGVDSILTRCYSYDINKKYKDIQTKLKTVIESIMPFKENTNQKQQQQLIEVNKIKNKSESTHPKKYYTNTKKPNVFSSFISPFNNKHNKKGNITRNKVMDQVKSSNKDILDKTKRIFGKHLVFNNTLIEIPRTIIINNNININIQRQISTNQLKVNKSNEGLLESNENYNYNTNNHKIRGDVNHSTRVINKNMEQYKCLNVISGNNDNKTNKNQQIKHYHVNL